MPTLAKTKAFLKDKWEMTELKDPPLCEVHDLPPGGILMFDQTCIHCANPQRMGRNKRARRYIFAAYETFNDHSGTNTNKGPIFKHSWIEQWAGKFDISYHVYERTNTMCTNLHIRSHGYDVTRHINAQIVMWFAIIKSFVHFTFGFMLPVLGHLHFMQTRFFIFFCGNCCSDG